MDLDDSLEHRARFALDRSWGMRGAAVRAVSTSWPREGITLQWHLDDQPLSSSHPAVGTLSAAPYQGIPAGDVRFQILSSGVHFLTLTAQWSSTEGPLTVDRVTSPIYLEDSATDLIQMTGVVGGGFGDMAVQPAKPAVSASMPPLEVTYPPSVLPLAKNNLPTIVLISDFLDPNAPWVNLLRPVLPFGLVDEALGALPDQSDVDLGAGFGPIYLPLGSVTETGTELTHLGQSLFETLAGMNLANVMFVSGIDPKTGNLNRAAIRNALEMAQQSSFVHAVVWGLPSQLYQPAELANGMRPNLNRDETPLFALSLAEPLPLATKDWRASEYVPEPRSVTQTILEEAFRTGHADPVNDTGRLGEILWNSREDLAPSMRTLVEAFRNDQQFDDALRLDIEKMGLAGVNLVAPSDDCGDLGIDQYMTLTGLTQIPGVVTVAPGTEREGPQAFACKGPGRLVAAHGTGIDFFVDPEPVAMDTSLLSSLGVSNLPFENNSFGAALKAGLLMAWIKALHGKASTPFRGLDYLGALAAIATPHPLAPAPRQGSGYLDAVSTDFLTSLVTLPEVFARGSNVVFTPWDPFRGTATAVVQLVTTTNQMTSAFEGADLGMFRARSDSSAQTSHRIYTNESGALRIGGLGGKHDSRMHAVVKGFQFDPMNAQYGLATLTLEAVPSNMARHDPTNITDPPREWLLPGLYSGRTWINTPSNGLLQLPINIGVGNILDVYRFLAPHTPVSDTAVCLALPISLIKDIPNLRMVPHELPLGEVCLYWTNTDEAGVARFYTPLPLSYELISFFSPRFSERLKPTTLVDGTPIGASARSRAPPYYPQIKAGVTIESPVNVTGIEGFAADAPNLNWYQADATGHPRHPVYVDANLPYPLVTQFQNLTFPTAIAVNWAYRDNIEANHFLPIPSILSPEFLTSIADLLPNPLNRLTNQAGESIPPLADGLIQSAPDQINAILGTVQDNVKGTLPPGVGNSTYVDSLLAQPITQALPLSLQADPGSCSWGYGHESSPLMTGIVDDLYDKSKRNQQGLDQVFAELAANQDLETPPDMLAMRIQPTLNYLLGLTTNLPLCIAAYPINFPQPNYDSFYIHEFDLHLENSIMFVCLVVSEIECFVIVPNPLGDGVFVVPTDKPLSNQTSALFQADPGRLLGDAISLADPNNIDDFANRRLGETRNITKGIANISLPDKIGLTQDGHVNLLFEQPSAEHDNGVLYYVALPLDLNLGGFIDPIVGILERSGITPDMLPNITVPGDPLGTNNLTADLSDLIRDSLEGMLRSQAYIEVKRPVFHFDTWWWIDSFFDARISPTALLPRAMRDLVGTPHGSFELGEDFWWPTFPNINREYFEYGLKFWDPVTLQPNLTALAAAKYPWRQAEYFEAVLQFWDDEHVKDATPNQMHLHDRSTPHEMVNFAQHCTDFEHRQTLDGPALNDENGQYCFDGLLAYEEGDNYLRHTDHWGNGIYDPDLGLFGVNLEELAILDGLFGPVNNAWQNVWSTRLGYPLFEGPPRTLAQVVAGLTGVNMQNLTWWDRDAGPTVNRRIYADMHTNSSYFLWPQQKSCEERYDLPGQLAVLFDAHPRWKIDCPWKGGWNATAGAFLWQRKEPDLAAPKLEGATSSGWFERDVGPPVPTAPPAGAWQWHSRRGVQCEAAPWERFAPMDDAQARASKIAQGYGAHPIGVEAVVVFHDGQMYDAFCGEYDGWEYWVLAASGFDGPAARYETHYQRVLAPRFYNGTFGMNFPAWSACKETPVDVQAGWSCSGDDPMDQVWDELVSHVRAYPPRLRDLRGAAQDIRVSGLELALLMFGLSYDQLVTFEWENGSVAPVPLLTNNGGGDRGEHYATVPLPSNPDKWYGPDPAATEFPGLYVSDVFNESSPWAQVFQEEIRKAAPLLRAWLKGDMVAVNAWLVGHGMGPITGPRAAKNPFWDDVTGRYVPFQEYLRSRATLDNDAPRRVLADGTVSLQRECVGVFWLTRCHEQSHTYDAGDLTGFGRAGYWGHESKKKILYIPQGSTFARWNKDKMLPTPSLVTARFDAAAVHAHREDATGQPGCPDQWTYWILAPVAVEMAPDGWSLASAPPPDGAAAPAGQRWWTLTANGCTVQPWTTWQSEAAFTPDGALAANATGESVGLTHLVGAYYFYGENGICWFDPLDRHGEDVLNAHAEGTPFDVTAFNSPHHYGTYSHQEGRGFDEPFPSIAHGRWCPDVRNGSAGARSVREYIPLRLPKDIVGGDPDLTEAPPIMPYVAEGSNEFPIVDLAIDVNGLGQLAVGILNDVLGIADGISGPALGGLGTGLNTLNATLGTSPMVVLTNATGAAFVGGFGAGDVAEMLRNKADESDEEIVRVVKGASPVAPILGLRIDSNATAAELVAVHSFDFPKGTQGFLMVSEDLENWSLLHARGSPGFVGRSHALGGSQFVSRLAFFDLTDYIGKDIVIGSQIMGDLWRNALWDIPRLTVLPAGSNGAIAPPIAGWDSPLAGFTQGTSASQIAGLPTGSRVHVQAPITVGPSQDLVWKDKTIVVDRCPNGDYCPIVVDGTLRLENVRLSPRSSAPAGSNGLSEGVPMTIHGALSGLNVTLEGLLGGLRVLGGRVDLADCWFVDTGHVGVMAILGRVAVRDCVFADQVVGIYTLGSEVRIAHNLFYRMIRSAVTVDESWGVIRDNVVVHTKQAAFYSRSPLGAGNLAVFGNRVEETGMGAGSALALEDRLLGLNPLDLSVPVEARHRYQGNWFEWNNLEALEAGPLSAPVIYGNNETHNNIGVRVGWLDPAVVRFNNLYSNHTQWTEPARRNPLPQDGNVWAGLWQLEGLKLPVAADNNYWGPGPVEVGGRVPVWPVDLIRAGGPFGSSVAYEPAAGSWQSVPLKVALAAPGYDGGLGPILRKLLNGVPVPLDMDDVLSPLNSTIGLLPDSIVDPDLVPGELLDQVPIDGFLDRKARVAFEVDAGVEAIRVNGTFYTLLGAPIPTGIDNALELAEVLKELPITDPLRVLSPIVSRYDAREITLAPSQANGSFTYQFDGWNESRVVWRVAEYRVGGAWIAADAISTKSVSVHNSIVWPLLLDLAFLVNDLAFDVLPPDWVLQDTTIPSKLVHLEPGSLSEAKLPLGFLADGALALDGVPGALTLARDQDPILMYEAKYNLSTAPGASHPLSQGVGRQRSWPLPEIPEGVTLSVQVRGVDASGWVSPPTGVSLLKDAKGPTLQLSVEDLCLDINQAMGRQDGIGYLAQEWIDPAWLPGDGRRPSGLAKMRIEAVPPSAAPFVFEITGAAQNVFDGTWYLPDGAVADNVRYAVRGMAQDRAGHIATQDLGILTVDSLAPTIQLPPELVPVADSIDLPIELPDLGPVTQPVLVLLFKFLDAACGLAEIVVERYVDGILNATWSLDPSATHYADEELSGLDGRRVYYKVRAFDVTGKSTEAVTGDWIVNFNTPDVGVIIPDSAGDLAQRFARTTADGIDLGPGAGGATVLSPRPSEIPLRLTVSLGDPNLSATKQIWIDGVDRSSGLVGDDFLWEASDLSTNVHHEVVVKATASNGFTRMARAVFYFPFEPDPNPLEETAAGWTFVAGSGGLAGRWPPSTTAAPQPSSFGVRLVGPSVGPSSATRATTIESDAFAIEGSFSLDSTTGGPVQLLRAMEGAQQVAELRTGGTNQLVLTGPGGVAASFSHTLNANTLYSFRLAFTPTTIGLSVAGASKGSVGFASHSWHVTALELTAQNRGAWWDGLIVKPNHYGIAGSHFDSDASRWIGTVPVGSTPGTHVARIESGPDPYARVKSTDGGAASLLLAHEIPASRVVLEASVAWNARTTPCPASRFAPIEVLDGEAVWFALALQGCSNSILKLERRGLPTVAFSFSLPQNVASAIRFDIGETGLDFYFGGLYQGTYDLLPAESTLGGLRMSAVRYEGTLNAVTVRSLSNGFWRLGLHDVVTTTTGWTTTGTGSLGIVATGEGSGMRVDGTSASYQAFSPNLNLGRFGHVSGYVRIEEPVVGDLSVFSVQTTAGSRMITVKAVGTSLLASDGSSGWKTIASGVVPGAWHRFDLDLLGSTWRLRLDGGPSAVTGRTLVQGPIGKLVFGGSPTAITVDRLRAEITDGLDLSNSFEGSLGDQPGWHAVQSTPGALTTSAPARLGGTALRVAGTAASGPGNHVSVTHGLAGGSPSYQMSWKIDAGSTANHMSVAAGLTNAGQVLWAVDLVPVAPSDLAAPAAYFLTYLDMVDPTKSQLLSTNPVSAGAWHAMRADFSGNSLSLVLDEVVLKTVTPPAGTARIAYGDVMGSAAFPGTGVLWFDDATIHRRS